MRKDLHEWHKELPENIFSKTTEYINKLSPDIKAVLKRCAVCDAEQPWVDIGARDDLKLCRREKAQSLMADAFEQK